MKILITSILSLFILPYFLAAQDAPPVEDMTFRQPMLAGEYYPKTKKELSKYIIDRLDSNQMMTIESDIMGLILPGGKYEETTWMAVKALRIFKNKTYDAVIVLGKALYARYPFCSVYDGDAYSTPLGLANIDKELATEIVSHNDFVRFSKEGHRVSESFNEKGIELQLPYIQFIAPQTPIVPIMIGETGPEQLDGLIKAIVHSVNKLGKRVLITTLMNLQENSEIKSGREIDIPVIEDLSKFDYYKLMDKQKNEKWVSNTWAPTLVMMQALELLGASSVVPLQYAFNIQSPDWENKKDTIGNSYLTAVFLKSEGFVTDFIPKYKDDNLKELYHRARLGVERALVKDSITPIFFMTRPLSFEYGCAITIKKDGKVLNSGQVMSSDYQLIVQVEELSKFLMDVSNKKPDKEDIDSLQYDITVIGRLKRITPEDSIDVGNEGIMIMVSDHEFTLLPNDIKDKNISSTQYIEILCRNHNLSIKDLDKIGNALFKFKTFRLPNYEGITIEDKFEE